MKDVISAVGYLHKHDIVHRDCKLENFLISYKIRESKTRVAKSPIVKLTDFGFAAIAAENTLDDTIGTPAYVAPEILKHEKYGKPVDIWSCGVIAFVLTVKLSSHLFYLL